MNDEQEISTLLLSYQSGNKRKKTYLNECATYLVNTAKWEAAKNFCKKNDWDFVIMTEKDLFQ